MTTSAELMAGLSVLLVLYFIYRVVLGMGTGFSRRRALLTMNSVTGENLAVVLAAISLAALALDGTLILAESAGVDATGVAVGFAVVCVLGMAIWPRMALPVIALVGVVVQIYLILLEHGPAAATTTIVLAILLLMALSIARGLTGQ